MDADFRFALKVMELSEAFTTAQTAMVVRNIEALPPGKLKIASKMMIRDLFEILSGFDQSKLTEIEKALSKENLPSFSDIREKYFGDVRNLLKKKKLHKETDIYLLKGARDSGLLTDEESKIASTLLDPWEF